MDSHARSIIMFDGDCGLCNGFIAWLIRRDRHERFLIAGSAGEVGAAALETAGLSTEMAASTLVLARGDQPRLRSDAVAAIAAELPWPWRAASAIHWLPRAWRDGVYNAVAKRRPYRPAEDPACGTPPPELVAAWRARLATLADVEALGYEKTPHRSR
ncbi:thiol-disulfide oxidoreductase DCC family protein [uncultured Demequina sp.]|uniref:thiol-disulfide oxidoreductase DCC family protein n=1 Tax=uncultured Demequina sp. TaxID=693499 RepID=UPI0025E271E6|nr:DCC1-like thiol-disulfide oxidoreductase family protein [uncultured Demequina sp.]